MGFKLNWKTIVIVILIVTIVVLCGYGIKDYFGQDASIRASVGWLAGPKGLYGYDPIDHFANQIDEMRMKHQMEARALGCHEVCMGGDPSLCNDCIRTRRAEANMEAPVRESYREGHYPFKMNLNLSDCEEECDKKCTGGHECLVKCIDQCKASTKEGMCLSCV